MNREPVPCSDCARFVPGKAGTDVGHCTGYDRPVQSTDTRCVLFNEQGAWKTRKSQQPPKFD